MPILRAYRATEDETPDGPLVFTAATGGMKGDGIDLAGIPWDFSRAVVGDDGAARYPFLWVHDLAGRNLPLGVADVLTADDELPLKVAVRFDPDDEFARKVEAKYRSPVGGLAAVSIQWEDVDAKGQPASRDGKAAAHRLMEVSAVPVGMDPEALIDGARAALRSLLADDTGADATALETADTAASGDAGDAPADDGDNARDGGDAEAQTLEDLAAGMVAVFEPERWADDADPERRARYNALLPGYRRAGWTAPEFIPMADLWPMDRETWRGLFLAGELARVGAELSNKNLSELRDIAAGLRDAGKRLDAMITRVTGGGKGAGSDEPAKGEGRAAGADPEPARDDWTIDDLAAAFRRVMHKETNNE